MLKPMETQDNSKNKISDLFTLKLMIVPNVRMFSSNLLTLEAHCWIKSMMLSIWKEEKSDK